MMYTSRIAIFHIFITTFLHVCVSQSVVTEPKDGQPGSISFKPPSLNDEESHSPWMPSNRILQCDGCHIITFHLFNKLSKRMKQMTSLKGALPESEVLDIFEDICGKDYDSYGVKTIHEKNRLWGPGVKVYEKDFPGIIAGGGKWPGRLTNLCNNFIDKMGEMEIFKEFREKGATLEVLETILCKGSDAHNNMCADSVLGDDAVYMDGGVPPKNDKSEL